KLTYFLFLFSDIPSTVIKYKTEKKMNSDGTLLCTGSTCFDTFNCDYFPNGSDNSQWNISNCMNWANVSQPTSETGANSDPSYYAVPYRIIGTIFQGFIFIVGVYRK